jgi:hypothetical protein
MAAAGKGWALAVEGRAGGSAGRLHGVRWCRTASWRAWRRAAAAAQAPAVRCLFFLEHERCYLLCVSSNPNGLAWADWPSPLGLLYTTTHSLPHQRSQSRSHRGASPPPSAMKQPCCAARPEAILCRSTLLL